MKRRILLYYFLVCIFSHLLFTMKGATFNLVKEIQSPNLHFYFSKYNKKSSVCPMCLGAGTTILNGVSSFSTYYDGQWYPGYSEGYISTTCSLCKGSGKTGNNYTMQKTKENIENEKYSNSKSKFNSGIRTDNPAKTNIHMNDYFTYVFIRPQNYQYQIVLYGDCTSYFIKSNWRLVYQNLSSGYWFEFGQVFKSSSPHFLWYLHNEYNNSYLYVSRTLGVFDFWGKQIGYIKIVN